MHNLDEKTREIIRYYQKLTGVDEEETSTNPKAYARVIAELHRKRINGNKKESQEQKKRAIEELISTEEAKKNHSEYYMITTSGINTIINATDG